MDTTYLLENYILKHYEREVSKKLLQESQLLQSLQKAKCNTPTLLAVSEGWHLYRRLKGEVPKSISYFHIQAVARFLAKFHSITSKEKFQGTFLESYPLHEMLHFTKQHHYFYYKKLHSLKHLQLQNDGFIHGDLFKDNTLFDGEQIGVFDFIDGGVGAFSFDVAVALLSFNPHKRKSYRALFLRTYNQHAPKKITDKTLSKEIADGAKLYALLRIQKYKNIKKAKELANLW
jgi:homoserine kinase type II